MSHGWIILNKPEGISSTQAGGIVKRLFHQKKLGHGGTLDPFASGVLPLALGEATKVMPYGVAGTKDYEFEITFGEERDTGDREGSVVATTAHYPTQDQLHQAIPHFVGQISQTPPIYSALRVQGERAYTLARQGKAVMVPSRLVVIEKLEFLSFTGSTARFRVTCGPGTYVRSLGQDLARAVGSLGYLSQLCRTRVGKFSLQNAVNLDILKEMTPSQREGEVLLPIRIVLDDIPAIPVSRQQAVFVRQGRPIEGPPYKGPVLVLFEDREVAIGESDGQNIHPKRVFNL
jgi:tRNA pseudouridine55 synthase